MNSRLFLRSFSFCSILFLSYSLSGQERATLAAIKADDKKQLIGLFRGTDIKHYRIQFNSREIYGDRKISATEMDRIRQANLVGKGGSLEVKESNAEIIVLKDGTIILASGSDDDSQGKYFYRLLGKQKAEQLRLLVARYAHDLHVLDDDD